MRIDLISDAVIGKLYRNEKHRKSARNKRDVPL